jgi:hypothetical protein
MSRAVSVALERFGVVESPLLSLKHGQVTSYWYRQNSGASVVQRPSQHTIIPSFQPVPTFIKVLPAGLHREVVGYSRAAPSRTGY